MQRSKYKPSPPDTDFLLVWPIFWVLYLPLMVRHLSFYLFMKRNIGWRLSQTVDEKIFPDEQQLFHLTWYSQKVVARPLQCSVCLVLYIQTLVSSKVFSNNIKLSLACLAWLDVKNYLDTRDTCLYHSPPPHHISKSHNISKVNKSVLQRLFPKYFSYHLLKIFFEFMHFLQITLSIIGTKYRFWEFWFRNMNKIAVLFQKCNPKKWRKSGGLYRKAEGCS